MTDELQIESKDKKKNYTLWAMVGGFLFIGIAFFFYWDLILRFEESTDDAYVEGNQIVITPQISGYINVINVDETEIVREGKILATLDPIDQMILFEEAKHSLANTVRQVVSLFENVLQLKAERQIREVEKIKAYQDYIHRKELLDGGAVPIEQFEHAQASYLASVHAISLVDHQLQAAVAEIENTTIETHPRVEEAKDRMYKAFVDLQRCKIKAPAYGMIAQRQAQVGEAVKPGTNLMMLTPLNQIWVNANFKETQLGKVRIGQPVKMTSDIYGNDVVFHGKVAGLWPGTGSVFSVLPPQNATGNWIKIVQRLPVRISLDPEELKKHPLRLGFSMSVTVDIHNTEGEMLPIPTETSHLYETEIYHSQLDGVDELIAHILQENIPKSLQRLPEKFE